MKLSVVAVGRVRDSAYRTLCDDYQRRLERLCRFSLTETRELRGRTPEQTPRLEAERLLPRLEGPGLNVAMDEGGRSLTSEGLAQWLEQLASRGTRELRLVVGGAYGLDAAVRKRCSDSLSLSPMTLPHELARTVLLEQLYRAHTILARLPYHHR